MVVFRTIFELIGLSGDMVSITVVLGRGEFGWRVKTFNKVVKRRGLPWIEGGARHARAPARNTEIAISIRNHIS